MKSITKGKSIRNGDTSRKISKMKISRHNRIPLQLKTEMGKDFSSLYLMLFLLCDVERAGNKRETKFLCLNIRRNVDVKAKVGLRIWPLSLFYSRDRRQEPLPQGHQGAFDSLR